MADISKISFGGNEYGIKGDTARANHAAHESDENAHAALFAACNASIGALQSDFVQSEGVTPTLLNGATGTIQYRKSTMGRVEFCGTLTVITRA